MERICILPADIARLTGYSERYGQEVIKEIKKSLCKEKHQFITKYELATYMGINHEDIILK